MRRVILALLAGLGALAALQAPAATPAPEAKPLRILFIGNSLTSSGDIPGRLAKFAAAMGRKAAVETVAVDNHSLEDHWREGTALEAIVKGWDIVVLQQGPSAQPDSRAQLVEYSRRFARVIREAGAKPALYAVWPAQNRPGDFAAAISAYREAAAAVGGVVLPVGEAWLRALGADKRLRLYTDTVHAASFGQDLAVLTIYLALFPAGHQEFDDAFVARMARALEIPADRRELLVDAATRAIDEPLKLQ